MVKLSDDQVVPPSLAGQIRLRGRGGADGPSRARAGTGARDRAVRTRLIRLASVSESGSRRTLGPEHANVLSMRMTVFASAFNAGVGRLASLIKSATRGNTRMDTTSASSHVAHCKEITQPENHDARLILAPGAERPCCLTPE